MTRALPSPISLNLPGANALKRDKLSLHEIIFERVELKNVAKRFTVQRNIKGVFDVDCDDKRGNQQWGAHLGIMLLLECTKTKQTVEPCYRILSQYRKFLNNNQVMEQTKVRVAQPKTKRKQNR